MNQLTQRVDGIVTFWSSGDVDRTLIQSTLTQHGYGWLYTEPSILATLKAACGDVASRSQIVRPLKDKGGWAIVDEHKGHSTNLYNQADCAKLEADGTTWHPAASFEPKFTRQMNYQLSVLPRGAVGTLLAQIVQQLSGVALRPAGGFYWMPPQSVQIWKSITAPLEANGCTVYEMNHHFDAAAIKAVNDAIRAELQRDLDTIDQELNKTFVRARSYLEREDTARAIKDKAKLYEQLLSVSLTDITDQADKAEQAAAAAAFLTMTKKEEKAA